MRLILAMPGNKFPGLFVDSLMQFQHECFVSGIKLMISRKYTSNVYYVRSQCLGGDVRRGIHQKPYDGKIPYDYIMWVDSDIGDWNLKKVKTLASHNFDIVAGLYKMDNKTQYTVVEDWDKKYFEENGTFKFLTDYDLKNKPDTFEVAYSGFGFMLIKKGVFEKITYPWFEPKFHKIGSNCYDFSSEDVSFCIKAREAGFKIIVDQTVHVSHIKELPIM